MRIPRLLALTILLCAAGGCSKQELYSNLHERDANEMMAVLARAGITATKTAGEEEETWNLSVPTGSFAPAVETLNSLGFPKDEYSDMGLVFQKSGLVSSPSEERIRFVHALSQEVAHTLSLIDGVLRARVQIVLPNNDPFGDEVKPSSAAVFLKHRADADLESSIAKIKELVIGSIEGLGPENVTVALFPAEELAPPTPNGNEPSLKNVLSMQLAPESVAKFWAIAGGLTAISVLAIAVAVFAMVRSQSRADAAGAA